jgi:hypothetical protein
VENRNCPRHGITEFAHYSAGRKRGYRWRCKRCIGEAVTRRLQRINLHFHHVDPTKKSFAMTVAMGKSIATFRAEAKCVLVCANCHGEVEAGLIKSPPSGANFRGAA